jgi:VCBS repeat-containing protein
VSVYVLDNDTDPENHTLMVVSAGGGLGQVRVVNNREVVYDPAGKFNQLDVSQTAQDGFTYQISDGHGGLATGSVIVTVTGLNDPPVAVDDLAPTAQAEEDNPASIDVLRNDTDPERASLTVTLVQLAGTRGLVTVNQPGTPNNSVTYNPNGKFETLAVGQTATDLFTYVVADPQGNTSLATVTMTIQGRNDAPTAVNDTYTVARNGTLTRSVLANDRDIDRGDTLSITPPLGIAGTRGTVVLNGDNTVTYDPNRAFDYLQIGQQATDRFSYTISDGHGGSSTATVTLTVIGASNPPSALNDQATVGEKDSVIIPVLSNDTDDFGPLSVASVNTVGLKGNVLINPPAGATNNAVIYSPSSQFDYLADGQTAQETFTYVVTDGTGNSTGTVTVTVRGANDAPVANYDANGYRVQRRGTLNAHDARGTTTPGQAGDDGVLLNDTDAEGDAITAVLVSAPQHAVAGTFRLNVDGTFSYSHNGDAATVDSFAYQARDAHNALSQQVVTVLLQITDAPPPDWQNPISQFDVNNDGFVSPVDVLLVINYINEQGSFQLPTPRPVGAYFYDINGDGWVKPDDVVALINELNARNLVAGEGEAAIAPSSGEVVAQGVIAELTSAARGASASRAPVSSAGATEQLRQVESPWTAPAQAESHPRLTARMPQTATITLDPYGLDELLGSLAEDVHRTQGPASALDAVLAELLATS